MEIWVEDGIEWVVSYEQVVSYGRNLMDDANDSGKHYYSHLNELTMHGKISGVISRFFNVRGWKLVKLMLKTPERKKERKKRKTFICIWGRSKRIIDEQWRYKNDWETRLLDQQYLELSYGLQQEICSSCHCQVVSRSYSSTSLWKWVKNYCREWSKNSKNKALTGVTVSGEKMAL